MVIARGPAKRRPASYLERSMASSFTLTFHGAAQTVTGSMHLIEHAGRRILLDCGLYQGSRKLAFEVNRNPAVEPSSIDFIILSHAHLDHSGNLPTFARMGFKGKVFATPATADLAGLVLRDSANVQVRQVELVNRVRKAENKNPFEPLYKEKDAYEIIHRFEPVPYGRRIDLGEGLSLTFLDAGHILGSALTLLEFGNGASRARLLYTGDLGRRNSPILRDPAPAGPAEFLITESTYGDRLHPTTDETSRRLESIIHTVIARKSRLIVPAFSIGRVQTLIYHLNQLHHDGRIGDIPVYMDSPLSNKATDVFIKHQECYDAETTRFLTDGHEPFSFSTLHVVESIEDSKKLNTQKGPLIILSSSGMCEGGRILHHLVHGVEEPDNFVLLTGYQAAETLGRRLADGVSPVNILGRSYVVRAKVEMLESLSAHADAQEMIEYYNSSGTKPEKVFLVHGEPQQAAALKEKLEHALRWKDIMIPAAGESFAL